MAAGQEERLKKVELMERRCQEKVAAAAEAREKAGRLMGTHQHLSSVESISVQINALENLSLARQRRPPKIPSSIQDLVSIAEQKYGKEEVRSVPVSASDLGLCCSGPRHGPAGLVSR